MGAATALMFAVSLATATSAQATFTGKIGLVLFTRGGDLYTANSSGGAITRLTTVGQIGGPKWSPNGKTIVYRRGTTIYTRTYPGGVTKAVATRAYGDPQWSPDGSKIAYFTVLAETPCGDEAVQTVPAAGGTPTNAWLPGGIYDYCPGYVPNWTLGTYLPNGQALVTGCYSHAEDSDCDLFSVPMDGGSTFAGGFVAIACTLPFDESAPRCAHGEHLSDGRTGPAGTTIYFSGKGGYDTDFGYDGTLPGSTAFPSTTTLERPYAISSAGTNLHPVTTATSGYSVTRAPTGSAILFTQKANSTTNILKASSDAATVRATTFITNGSQPDWQPAP